MKKNILDTIGMIIISLVIIVFSLIIGANEKVFRILPICILLFITNAYLITRKIILKEKIVIKNKIDLLVLLFMCSTLLPCIFKTYCTFQGTVEFIIKYFFVYAIYLVVRNTVDSQKKINIIIAVTIFGSLIIAILGIDIQHKQCFEWLINKLDLNYSPNTDIAGTFGYPNTVAIYFSFCIFLAINQIQNAKKLKTKIPYGIYIIFALYIISQTGSRAVFVLFGLAIVIYFLVYYLQTILKHKEKFLKASLIFAIISILFIIFVFTIGTKVSKPYVFTDSTYQRNLKYNFEPNQEYTIKLELDIEHIAEDYGGCVEIDILEINTYFNEKALATKQVILGDETVTLNFKTTENSYQIDMLILNEYNEKISINKCYINEKEYPIAYRFLPYGIGKTLTTYSINDWSIKQRMDFWNDCIKIAKQHPIIGQGGNTWKKLSQTVQEYPYGMKESHSYFFELLISYGIVGVMLYILLFVFFYIKIIKENKEIKYKLPILFGLNLVIIHSLFFDFNMSFVLILLLTFIYIANMMYDSNKQENELKIVEYGILTFLNIILLILISANIAKYGIKDKNLRKNLGFYDASYQYEYINECIEKKYYFRYNLKEIQKLMEKEPYAYQNELSEKYWKLIFDNLEKLDDSAIIEYLDFINKQYKTYKNPSPMYINTILPRVSIMKNAYIILKDINFNNQDIRNEIEELKQIIKDEYEINIINIRDKERNGSSQSIINNITQKYNKILKQLEA